MSDYFSQQPPREMPPSSSSSDDEDEIQMLKKMSQLELGEKEREQYIGTGFIYDPVMTKHKCEWDPNFPENPKRVTEPYKRCEELGLVSRCQRLQSHYATEDDILTKHDQEHLDIAQSTADLDLTESQALAEKYDSWYSNQACYATEDQIMLRHAKEHVEITKSTAHMTFDELVSVAEGYHGWYPNNSTYEAALMAAGSTLAMTEQIMQGKISNGFAMVRPPGHHAGECEFNGFCTFNNVALATQFALNRGIEKILIVDWDVHHGQGVQRMFYDEPRVLYFSIHRYEYGRFWPNLRESDYDYVGKGKGEGFNINIPLNKTCMTDSDYMAIFHQVLLPVAYEFCPQLILISSGYDAAVGCPEFCPKLVMVCSGFDAAVGDEKGEMLLSPAMYAHMTHYLMALAGGRVCTVLEGGYCIKSLAEGCALTLRSLLQDPCPLIPATEPPSTSILTTLLNVIKCLRPHWDCFNHYKVLERSKPCVFEEVNHMPPVEGVEFDDPLNPPEKHDIYNVYPIQSQETIQYFSDLIDQLIANTSLTKAENKCCYVFDADMRAHRNLQSKSHPERPDRISSIYSTLLQWKLLKRCLTVPSRLARKKELLWIHGEAYIDDIVSTQNMENDELEEHPMKKCYNSIYLHQKSLHCALLSCGSVLNVVEAVLTGQAQSGIAVVRPPGHHAECHKAMGFCFFNNVAVAAKFAQKKFGVKRILILDWDVHHGNATQHQFYNDPSVLYISLHRYDNGRFFPNSPDADMQNVGHKAGEGFNVNIPFSYGKMGDPEYITAFTQIVMPIAYQFAPELVLVSAGFDAAKGDPLGGYSVTPAGYGHMTHMLMGLANGRVVLALEGGYNLYSISESMATCTSVLLGDPCPMLSSMVACERAADIINEVLEVQKKFWSCLKGRVKIPSSRQVENQKWDKEKEEIDQRMTKPGSQKGKTATSTNKLSRPATAKPVLLHSDTSDSTASATETESSITDETSQLEASTQATSLSTTTKVSTDTTTTIATPDESNESSNNPDSTVPKGEKNNQSEPSLLATGDTPRGIDDVTSAFKNLDVNESQAADLSRTEPPIPVSPVEPNTTMGPKPGTCVSSGDHIQALSTRPATAPPVVSRPLEASGGNQVLADASLLKKEVLTPSSTGPGLSTVSQENPPRGTEDVPPSQPMSTDQDVPPSQPMSTDQDVPPSQPMSTDHQTKIFVSTVYKDETDLEPLSIFAGLPLTLSQQERLEAQNKDRKQRQEPRNTQTTSEQVKMSDGAEGESHQGSMGTTESDASGSSRDGASGGDDIKEGATSERLSNPGGDLAAGSSGTTDGAVAGGSEDLQGACGGSSRPNTVDDLLRMQGAQQMYAIQPLTWCPHLTEVTPLPAAGLSATDSCSTCGDTSENWVCLTCYKVECSRFVNEHMLYHRLETEHNMVLSYSDISVWCYACDHYVDNEAVFPMKNAAHVSKFGERLPGFVS